MRSGDIVKHRPTGENWTVAFVEGDDLVPCGWPLTYARPTDCDLIKAASDVECNAMITRLAAMNDESDARCRYGRRMLAREDQPNI